jgi:hypothetical protein
MLASSQWFCGMLYIFLLWGQKSRIGLRKPSGPLKMRSLAGLVI